MSPIWWALQNTAYFGCAVGLSYLAFRRMPWLLRLVMAAWAVVAAKYLSFAATIATQVVAGTITPPVLLQWAVLTPYATVFGVSVCLWLVWRERYDWAAAALVTVAANWIVFEVVGVGLALLAWPFWTWGVPALSVVTVVALGATAAGYAAGHRTRG